MKAREPRRPGTVEVLGVRFHNLDRAQAAEAIARMVKSGERGYVVKPYSEFMPPAARSARIRDVLNSAALCLPDGAGIIWAAHYLSLRGGAARALLQLPLSLAALAFRPQAVRTPLTQAMAGVDLTWEMLSRLDEIGASVFLLGGREKEAERTRRRIEERFGRVRIAGARNGYFDANGPENERVLEEINDSGAQVLLVGMGFPRQELWIAENMPRLRVNVAVAEGGSFSFISGATARAPRWMRSAGLEWLFRLLRQPARLRRQLALPLFVWLVIKERLRKIAADF